MKKTISTDLAPAAIGPYAQAVATDGLVITSGQLPIDPATGAFPEGIAAQTKQSLENVKAILAEAGVGMDRIIKTTVFLSDMNNFGAMNEVYSVLLSDEAGEDAIQTYTREMQQKIYIKQLDYISKEQALKEHIEEMGTDPEEFLGSNPFSPSLEVHLKADYANSDSLSWITRDIKSQPIVLNVVYQKDLIDSLNQNLQKVSLVLLILAALLTFVSFGLINSTVKMSLYANRFLIHTMKLVGARWSFIRRPFLSRSFWIGLTSAVLANGVLLTGIHLFVHYDPVLENIITRHMVAIMSGAVLLAGILLTMTCSYLSVNKFLKMKAGELHEM